jgi:hypothetical protein
VGRTRGAGVALGVNVAVGVAVGVAVAVGVGVGPDWAQYLPPVFKTLMRSSPPQTIISLKVQTAVCKSRAEGALVVLVDVQLFVPGLYLPPVLKTLESKPPQMIISLPVHTAV